jgi:hypothetical protein
LDKIGFRQKKHKLAERAADINTKETTDIEHFRQ